MPIFEFHCDKCNQDFEKLVFGSDPEVECPTCGGQVTKLMSACAFKTDYHGFMSTPSSGSKSSCSGCSSTSCSSCG
jgi:putative FmdB family regulatory protein